MRGIPPARKPGRMWDHAGKRRGRARRFEEEFVEVPVQRKEARK